MSQISTFEYDSWSPAPNPEASENAAKQLENGQVVFMPALSFELTENEKALLTPNVLKPGRKNVCYSLPKDKLKGCKGDSEQKNTCRTMMKRFASSCETLVNAVFPQYQKELIIGRTSYRPVEAEGRPASYRKNDMLLHVDSFPATPTNGKRILRVFSNINPNNTPRVWRLGEPYENVMQHFMPDIKKPFPGSRFLLNIIGETKRYRSLYDHYMLNIHHKMKKDQTYQNQVAQETVELPANTTWMVYTDLVSHAAMSGQYMLEQTFYLPVDAQYHPELSPLKRLEKHLNQTLV